MEKIEKFILNEEGLKIVEKNINGKVDEKGKYVSITEANSSFVLNFEKIGENYVLTDVKGNVNKAVEYVQEIKQNYKNPFCGKRSRGI